MYYAFKETFITPIVKKPGLDVINASSYRPISNLSVLSKLLQRLVVRQLMEYLSSADLNAAFTVWLPTGTFY